MKNLTVLWTTIRVIVALIVLAHVVSLQSYAGTPKNLEWRGSVNSTWDTTTKTNWFDTAGLTNAPFTTGDNATFDDTGIGNPVNITNVVEPGLVTISANTINYTFNGVGSITNLLSPTAGTNIVSLTKNNNGTLTMLTTNSYTGVTTLNGGIMSVGQLANGGSPCAIGAAANASTNLVFNGGELQYTGPSVTINRGATFNAGGGTLVVSTAGNILTDSGVLAGIGGLTISGSGVFALSGANTYSGGTLINSGVELTLTSGGTLGNGNVTNNGILLVSGNAAINNNISGMGILTNAAGSALLLGGSNTFIGNVYSGTTNLAASTLLVSNSAALNGTSEVILAGGSSATLDLAGNSASVGAMVSIPPTVTLIMETGNAFVNRAAIASVGVPGTWNGPVQLLPLDSSSSSHPPGDFCTFSSASASAPLIINGNVIVGGANAFLGNVTLAGTGGIMNGTVSVGPNSLFNIATVNGSWTINSSGNIWGISDIADGKISLGANNALDVNVPVELGTNGVLDLRGFNQQVAGLTTNQIASFSSPLITNSSPIASTLTYTNPAGYFQSTFITNSVTGTNYAGTYTNFAGIIGGKLGVTVAGGVLNLSGADTYFGVTTISNGTILALTGSGSVANSADIIVGPNATFSVSSSIGVLSANIYGLGSAQTLTGAGGTGTLAGNMYMKAGSSLVLCAT